MLKVLAVTGLSAALAGCTHASTRSTGPAALPPPTSAGVLGKQVADYFSPPQPFPGPAWTRHGRPVSGRVLNSIAGPEHCGWQSAVLLHLGWPLRTRSESISQVRQYVRDPRGVLGPPRARQLTRHVTMPQAAADTGYRYAGLQLWLSAAEPGAAYLRTSGDVERWPRLDPPIACA